MQKISKLEYSQIQPSLLKEKGTDRIVNERQLVIKDFLDALNIERIGTQYKPLTAKGVACKVGHLSTPELKMFYQQCNNYKGEFGKCFFGSLK